MWVRRKSCGVGVASLLLGLLLAALPTSHASAQNFVRGDANADGMIDIADAIRILEHVQFGVAIPPPMDRADVNDNEFITLTDGFMLVATLFCPPFPVIPAPHPAPGPDPTNSTGNYGFMQPGYSIDFEVRNASASSITYAVLVTSPQPVIGVEFAVMSNSPLLTTMPVFTPAPGQSPTTIFEDHDSVLYGIRVGYDNCTDLIADIGVGQLVGTLRYDLGPGVTPPCSGPLLNWVPDTIIGGNHYRGAVITKDFDDKHPSASVGQCAGFIRGDANGDQQVMIADTIYMLSHYINEFNSLPPVNCVGEPFLESADVNDNEWFTIADILYLNASLFMAPFPSIGPPTTQQCGLDPDNDQKGFDVVNNDVGLAAIGTILPGEYRMQIFARSITLSEVRAVTFIVEFDNTVTMPPNPRDVFCPSGFLDPIFLVRDGNRLICTVINDDFAPLPGPDASGRYFLGTMQFAQTGTLSCPANPVVFVPEHHYAQNDLTYRATVVGANLLDVHPTLGTPACNIGMRARFIRGDCNGDGSVDIGDPICNLAYQFTNGVGACLDALDTNDDGSVTLGDPVTNLAYLFQNGPTPPNPFPGCGPDVTMDCLRCQEYPNPNTGFQCPAITTP